MSCEGQSYIEMEIPLSVTYIAYRVVLDSSADLVPVSSQKDEEDPILKPVWANSSSFSHDFLDDTLPSYDAILDAINGSDRPWDDMHHHSYFLLDIVRIKQDGFRSTLSEIVGHTVVPLDMHNIYVEGNMAIISPTVTINISQIPSKIENVYIGADCLLE
jgi:hypothetical protein